MSDDPQARSDDVSMITDDDVPIANSDHGKAAVWGPWATLGWSFLLFLIMVVIQLLVFVGFVIALHATTQKQIETIATDSRLLSAATCTSTPIIVGLILLLIYLRGCSIRDYLAWRIPGLRATVLAIAGLALILIASDALSYATGRPLVPDVMVDIYKTGWFIPLAFTTIVAAPFGEEILFRGFFFQGIARSNWGPFAAIILGSFAWALIHVQYDAYTIAHIVILGFFLGEVRRRSESLPLTILLHAIANLVATTEMVILVRMQGG